MRAIIAHAHDEDVRELREYLFGAGFECHEKDCVAWDELAARLAKGDFDLVILRIDRADDVHFHAIQDALLVTSAPKLAVGRGADQATFDLANQLGINDYVEQDQFRQGLSQVFARLRSAGLLAQHSGSVITVFAPAPGSGATTVALNLAASLASNKEKSVALIELSREPGDLAVMLDLQPLHTAEQVCQRWQKLDQIGFRTSLCVHPRGLHVLANAPDGSGNDALCPDAVRRITIISRIVFDHTMVAVDSRLSEEALTAMRLSDAVLMVVRPDVPALRRAQQASATAFERGVDRQRFKVVVNRWGQRGQLAKDQIESSLRIRPLEFIPDDPAHVNQAVNQGRLIHDLASRSKIVRGFEKLAASLLNGTYTEPS
jgi:pilus assembly protein CpaE